MTKSKANLLMKVSLVAFILSSSITSAGEPLGDWSHISNPHDSRNWLGPTGGGRSNPLLVADYEFQNEFHRQLMSMNASESVNDFASFQKASLEITKMLESIKFDTERFSWVPNELRRLAKNKNTLFARQIQFWLSWLEAAERLKCATALVTISDLNSR